MDRVITTICSISVFVGFAACDCGVVPIAEWGTPSFRTELLPQPVHLVIVQHTVTPDCWTDAACEDLARDIRRNHIKRGFFDIGLSFLIGGNGKVYEGAGWHVGAHSVGFNARSISLSFVGDFRQQLPSSAALQAAIDMLECSKNNGNLSKNYKLVGHTQIANTASPGAALQEEIQNWPHWANANKRTI